MNCLTFKEIRLYIDCELDKNHLLEVEKHLNDCIVCNKKFNLEQKKNDLFKKKLCLLEPQSIPNLKFNYKNRNVIKDKFDFPFNLMAIAAVLLIFIGVISFMNSKKTIPIRKSINISNIILRGKPADLIIFQGKDIDTTVFWITKKEEV